VKLWIDECLSPALVEVSQDRYETTCNQYRGKLGAKDPDLYAVVTEQEFVFVTNNERDFVSLTRHTEVHPGLMILPMGTRLQQKLAYAEAIVYVEQRCAEDRLTPAAWMVNRLVEYHPDTTRQWRGRFGDIGSGGGCTSEA